MCNSSTVTSWNDTLTPLLAPVLTPPCPSAPGHFTVQHRVGPTETRAAQNGFKPLNPVISDASQRETLTCRLYSEVCKYLDRVTTMSFCLLSLNMAFSIIQLQSYYVKCLRFHRLKVNLMKMRSGWVKSLGLGQVGSRAETLL